MTPANYGSVFSCCLFGSLMMLYLYVFCRSKRFILRNGTFVIYLAVGVVMIRMLLPWNFHFAMNVESHKILPFLFDLLRVKILSVEFLTILVIIFCFGSCLRLALYFSKLFLDRHLLHQLDPLDDVRISRIFSKLSSCFLFLIRLMSSTTKILVLDRSTFCVSSKSTSKSGDPIITLASFSMFSSASFSSVSTSA